MHGAVRVIVIGGLDLYDYDALVMVDGGWASAEQAGTKFPAKTRVRIHLEKVSGQDNTQHSSFSSTYIALVSGLVDIPLLCTIGRATAQLVTPLFPLHSYCGGYHSEGTGLTPTLQMYGIFWFCRRDTLSTLQIPTSNMNFSGSKQTIKPPQRGIFPLDHDSECKPYMEVRFGKEHHNKEFLLPFWSDG